MGETLIKVELCSISGSEYMALANPGVRPLPHIMGHGITGTTPQAKRVAVCPLRGCGLIQGMVKNLPINTT